MIYYTMLYYIITILSYTILYYTMLCYTILMCFLMPRLFGGSALPGSPSPFRSRTPYLMGD